ncbi:hypothetical protein TSOC_007681 [Tetrabaena socialis]|uniref:Protein kinase domain-containing protein n=1 Tax=Tetrabaena socialis TaxID=47790 RepID=A0A2J8A0H6_9CHLO|nr:hypothetical protein TSOC_007681 [Tetrabaena socialis]|eukprot:PNH06016.1 hypothetical protein TSOC_007681 [Tetrabaena socialis]
MASGALLCLLLWAASAPFCNAQLAGGAPLSGPSRSLGDETGCSPLRVDAGSQQSNNGTWLLSNCALDLADPAPFASHDPRAWLPAATQAAVPPTTSFQLSNVTLRAASCASVWELAARECTFRVAGAWPSPGLEAGPGFLFFPALTGATSYARRLNVTCPTDQWSTLAAAASPPGLQPCGTATVTSGAQLLAVLAALQPDHARLLITLAANISLPASRTPLRVAATFNASNPSPSASGPALIDNEDDPEPLALVYRNVTLAGLGSPGAMLGTAASVVPKQQRPTELDLRGRRNALQLVQPGTRGGGGRAGPAGSNITSYVVLSMTDVALVNIPHGPLSTWPLSFLPSDMWSMGLDRTPSAPIQLQQMRMLLILNAEIIRYFSYWYSRVVSLVAEERQNAAWLLDLITPSVQAVAEDGTVTLRGFTRTFIDKYNVTSRAAPLLTAPDAIEIDLWSAGDPPMPPSAFALVRSSQELLLMLQMVEIDARTVMLRFNTMTLSFFNNTSFHALTPEELAGWEGGTAQAGSSIQASALGPQGYCSLQILMSILRRPKQPPPPAAMANESQAVAVSYASSLPAPEAPRAAVIGGAVGGAALLVCAVGLAAWVLVRRARLRGRAVAQGPSGAEEDEKLGAAGVRDAGGGGAGPGTLAGTGADDGDVVGDDQEGVWKGAKGGALEEVAGVDGTRDGRGGEAAEGGVAGTPMVELRPSPGRGALHSQPGVTMSVGSSPGPAPAAAGRGPAKAHLRQPQQQEQHVAGPEFAGALVSGHGSAFSSSFAADARLPPLTMLEQLQLNAVAGEVGRSQKADGSQRRALTGLALGGAGGGWEGGGGRPPPRPGAAMPLAPSTAALQLAAGGRAVNVLQPQRPATPQPGTPITADVGGPMSQPQLADVSPFSAGGGTNGSGTAQMDLVGEIDGLIRKIEASTAAAGPQARVASSSGKQQAQQRVLGSGGFGVVYKGEWRGLPVAIKVVLLQEGDSASRRQRLVREVALTVTLSHPHIVPTYHYSVSPVWQW